jgi:hypothetical protein
MSKVRNILAAVFCLSCFSASAQNLTGIWRGHFNSGNRFLDSLGLSERYKFETQIKQTDKGFEGVTYSYKTTVFYGKAACVGTVSSKTKKVLLGETKLIEVRSSDGSACLMTCFLQYSKVGDEEFLEGTYTSIGSRDSVQCGGGTVFLRKVPTSDFYVEPFLAEKSKPAPPPAKTTHKQPEVKKPTPSTKKPSTSAPLAATKKPPQKKTPAPQKKNPTPPPKKKPDVASAPAKKPSTGTAPKAAAPLKKVSPDSFKREIPKPSAAVAIPQVLSSRINELVKTISTPASEVVVNIYDNGTVDNDTVSVYVDNKLVISKQRLTEKAITFKIALPNQGDVHELVMVAENLGEIPPNTSLMVVNAGDQQYEVRITSTEQKNAMVRFKREP